eukprot:1449342-Prymnesium_polylepis.1
MGNSSAWSRSATQRRRAHAHRSASRRTPAHATEEGPRPPRRSSAAWPSFPACGGERHQCALDSGS